MVKIFVSLFVRLAEAQLLISISCLLYLIQRSHCSNENDLVAGGKYNSQSTLTEKDGWDRDTPSVQIGAKGESPSHSKGSQSSALSLNLNMAETKSKASNDNATSRALAIADEHIAVQEQAINVVFDFADGSQGEGLFKLGHSVDYLKSYVESEYGIPMVEQVMYLDDKVMLDPLSLLDYESKGGQDEMFIRVEGDLPSDSKK
jgi:hypothetical protein